jgi:predicted CopG family antitoxin
MAVKTITIDMAAYDALSRHKQAGQSFSDVIKAHFRTGGTARDLLQAAAAAGIETETADRMAEIVASRRRHRARVPRP